MNSEGENRLLLDEGSFFEADLFVRHQSYNFDLEEQRFYTDGVITGTGSSEEELFVFSQDFTILEVHLLNIMLRRFVKIMDLAMKIGVPVIGINDSGGARIQEGVISLGGIVRTFSEKCFIKRSNPSDLSNSRTLVQEGQYILRQLPILYCGG
ncbi:MAG: hypothetical protein IPL16_18705 [Ignavibacteria bacterium]|nr:hypothetical protein [Ignavibacteria bacterium]